MSEHEQLTLELEPLLLVQDNCEECGDDLAMVLVNGEKLCMDCVQTLYP